MSCAGFSNVACEPSIAVALTTLLERHVDDAWAEAMKEKPQKGLEDLMDEQKQRDEAAKELFEKRVKDKSAHEKRRPEDNPDYWR